MDVFLFVVIAFTPILRTGKEHFGFFLIVRSLLFPRLLAVLQVLMSLIIDSKTAVLTSGGKRQD